RSLSAGGGRDTQKNPRDKERSSWRHHSDHRGTDSPRDQGQDGLSFVEPPPNARPGHLSPTMRSAKHAFFRSSEGGLGPSQIANTASANPFPSKSTSSLLPAESVVPLPGT